MPEALFVGREREKEVYKQFLARETPWVLIITGLGGIGKTTLLHQLAENTRTEPSLLKVGIVILDFANEELRNDPLNLLDTLTKETAPYCNPQLIDDAFKKVLQQNFDQLAQLRKERIETGVSESEDLALREIRHQMRELATEAFYAQIKTLTLNQLVIMLDTCEWLTEPEGREVGQWVLDELIPGIHTRLRHQGQQCPVVMVSRVQLKLDAINSRDQRRLVLPMLGKTEVELYLKHIGMQDVDFRQRVYEVTHGHALCISIIGDFWQKREEQEQPFTIADLPQLQLQEFSEIALIRFTNERVLKQLKSPFKELTRYGVLLRSFDLPLLRAVFPELLPESEALERFNHFIRYPYIESRGNYRYAFHELLREALAEETQKEGPEEWKCYHQRALDYFSQVSPHSPDWYYHLLASNEKQGLIEWQQAIQEARSSGKREYVGALLQTALDKALKLSPAARAEIAYEQGRFNYYGIQWDEAIKSYNEALTAFEEIKDYSGQAKALQAIGDVQRTLGKHEDALVSYEKALVLFRQVGNLLGEARCHQAMGDVQRLRNELDAAQQCYEQCLVVFRQVKDKSEEGKVLEAVGDVQRLRNEPDAALHSYEQALALYQEEKDRPKKAKVLKAIGDIQRLCQDKIAALESYGQALAIFGELKEPTEEANVRRAIEEMQRPPSEQEQMQQESEPRLPSSVLSAPNIQIATTQPQRHRSLSKRMAILIAALALLIIAGSIVTYSTVLRPAQLNAQATSQANTYATETVQDVETVQAELNIIATVAARNNSQATAIAAGLQDIYPQATSGSPIINDPLSGQDSNKWDESTDQYGGCIFLRGAYHVIQQQAGYFRPCAVNTSSFSNFTFQIEMKIIKGDYGGIIFRADVAAGNYYYFQIGSDGSYQLTLYKGPLAANAQTLDYSPGPNSIVYTGLNQTNLITVVARNNNFYLFINRNYLISFSDSTYTIGAIGVLASDTISPTDVAFNNAQVWTL